MFQFEFPEPLLQFRQKGPALDPLLTLAPEMTSRSCLYTLQFYLFSALISGGVLPA